MLLIKINSEKKGFIRACLLFASMLSNEMGVITGVVIIMLAAASPSD